MKRFNSIRGAAESLLILAACAAPLGCADSKPVSAPPPQASVTKAPSAAVARPAGLALFRSSLVESQKEIDDTLASLNTLATPGNADLRGSFDKYCNQLGLMNDHAQALKTEADAMRNSRDSYFGKWEEKVTEIDNPTIRASAEARRKRLRDAHEKIVTASSDAKDAYVPFMKDLEDIRKYLTSDLSSSSIADLGDAIKKVTTDSAVVKEKIGNIVTTLDSVQSGA